MPICAAALRLIFYPFFLEGAALNDGLMQEDGIHPNAKGVKVIVENIMPKVEELLAKVKAIAIDCAWESITTAIPGMTRRDAMKLATIYDLKPQFQALLRPMAAALAKRGISANDVTLGALVLSAAQGAWLALMPDSAWPLLALPVTLFLRMAINAIDGLMAKEHGLASPSGRCSTKISDVAADAALYLPFALIAGFNAPLVVRVVVAGIIAEMTGALGPMIGGPLLCRAVRQERPRLRLRPAGRADRRRARARPVEHALSRRAAGAVGADRAQPRPRHRRPGQRQSGMNVFLGLPANVVYATAGIYAVLALATAIVALLRWRNPGERYAELTARTDSWWWMIGAFTLCVLVNQTVAIVFLAFISYLALKEYLSLIPTRRIDRVVLLFAYLAIPIQFYWAAIDWYGMFIVFVPVWMFLFFPALMALKGETARLPARGRHAVLGPDDDGVHAEPHGVAAGLGRSGQPHRRRRRAAVLSGGADPVQRRGAILPGASSSAATRSRRPSARKRPGKG